MAIVAKGFLDAPLANQIRDMNAGVTSWCTYENTNGKVLPYRRLQLAVSLKYQL